MEQENSRTKHVKNTIALTSTIALLGTSVGVSHQVKADDANSGDANTSNTSEATLAKPETDRKSTRLNSSHANISYAVFCLKKNNLGHAVRLPHLQSGRV